MRVGWVGLGKLGLPIAEEVAKTHTVIGYDIRPVETERVQFAVHPSELDGCDLVFVSVQTPHQPEFEGTMPLTDERADFDYSQLKRATLMLNAACTAKPPLVVVSTVLPGTIEREIVPRYEGPVVYNPFFIAMGEEVQDFLSPEFVLLGSVPVRSPGEQEPTGLDELITFYRSIGVDARVLVTGYREAELAKMAYNTFIGLKLAFANTIGELCHHLGIDASAVMNVVRAGDKRIVSPAYLSPGMGDGGPCHPRDQLALSWLARHVGLSFDLFGAVMEQREAHASWLADVICDAATSYTDDVPEESNGTRPVTILGRAFKPGTELETGSAALLLAELLRERGVEFDHVEDLP